MLLKINFGQLWTYPFQAGVWGTVSDWILILITAITGWLIYLTLKSQKNVQKDQYNLLKIESERFKEETKPTFEASHIPSASLLEEHTDKNFPTLIFTLKKNVAKNIEISVKEEGTYTMESYSGNLEQIYEGDGFMVSLKPKITDKSHINTKFCRLNVSFSDKYSVRYRQEFFFFYDDQPITSSSTTMIN